MKFILSLAALLSLAAALPAPAQGAQFPPGSVVNAKIGIPAPNEKIPEKRAGLAKAGIASGDCAVKGVSCKEKDIEHGIAKALFEKTGKAGGK